MRETDSGTLKEWISNIQTAWNATKTDVKAKEVAFKGTETNTKQLQYNSLYHKDCFDALKEQCCRAMGL